MSATAEQLTDLVLARVRDPHAIATDVRVVTRTFLDRAQQMVQAARPGWIAAVRHTIPAGMVLIDVRDFAPGAPPGGDTPPRCIRVVRINHEGRDLIECKWRRLAMVDRFWLVSRGSRPRMFARIGRDFVAVYPGSSESVKVTIHYGAQPPAFAAEDTETPLLDQRLPAVKALTEVLLLLRQQDVKALPSALESLRSQITWLDTARTAAGEVFGADDDAGGAGGGGAGGGGAGGSGH